MQEMSFWKKWLPTGAVALSLLASSGCSRKPEPAPKSASTPPATSTAAPLPEPGPGSDASAYVKFGIETGGSKGDLEGAIAAFNEAIKINPKFAPAYYNRGFAHSLQHKSDEALADYDQAIQIDPTYKEAYYQSGSLKGQKGDFDGAIADFSQVIKLDPKYAPAYYNLGHVYYFKGDLDNALAEINQALNLDPNFSYCYFIRGLIRHAQGHEAEATSDFQKSAGLNFPYASFWVWITQMESGQRGLAQKDISDALTKTGSFKAGDWPSQITGFLLGKITQDQLLAKATEGNEAESPGRFCEAWFYAGIVKRLSGDTKGAQDCFARAIATGAKGSEEFVEANREAAKSQKP
jgi:tetratricopeptide (TPR) repeat protein